MSEDDHIMFEEMPVKFGQMVTEDRKPNKVVQTETHKTYHSLYEELCDKCHPNRFLDESYDKKTFSTANSIYYELLQRKGWPDEQLKDLRNRAILELGIHFSTKKKYDYLSEYFDPRIYTQMEPYPFERVEKAKNYYDHMNDNREDIIALEQLENDAEEFIAERKNELEAIRKRCEKEDSEYFEKLNEAIRKEELEEKETEKRMSIAIAIILGITFISFLAFIIGEATG